MILITGATGFVGSQLSKELKRLGYSVRGTSRSQDGCGVYRFPLDSLDWSPVLNGVETIIHCAALSHVNKNIVSSLYETVREYNVNATKRLAIQAKKQGVKRFIFLSSIKALGEFTPVGQAFTNNSQYFPEDLYGISKRDAEVELKNELSGSDTELVIIRPPLVYGPGVKGNFKALIDLTRKNIPVPFGKVENRRSLVALDNLVSLIVSCVEYSGRLNQTFLVSDDYDVSTKMLFEELFKAQGLSPRFVSVPLNLMKLGATLIGKKGIANRLFGNLQLDITHTKKVLSWAPPLSFKQAIEKCITNEADRRDDNR